MGGGVISKLLPRGMWPPPREECNIAMTGRGECHALRARIPCISCLSCDTFHVRILQQPQWFPEIPLGMYRILWQIFPDLIALSSAPVCRRIRLCHPISIVATLHSSRYPPCAHPARARARREVDHPGCRADGHHRDRWHLRRAPEQPGEGLGTQHRALQYGV